MIPNVLTHLKIVEFSRTKLPYWNDEKWIDYPDDYDGKEIRSHVYLMIGKSKPFGVKDRYFLQWTGTSGSFAWRPEGAIELRQYLWNAIKTMPWRKHIGDWFDFNSLPKHEQIASILMSLARSDAYKDSMLYDQTLIIIPDHKYLAHAEVLRNCINFLKYVDSTQQYEKFGMKCGEDIWVNT